MNGPQENHQEPNDPGVVVAATWLNRVGDRILGVRPHGVDVYFLPGGIPEVGESLVDAVAREVFEEVGLVIAPNDLKEVARVEDDAYGRPGMRVQLICFDGPSSGTPAPGADEIAEIKWLDSGDWHRFAPAVRKALAQVRDHTASRASEIRLIASAWDDEYATGRYVHEPPVAFADEILEVASSHGLAGARGLYIGCGNGRNFLPLMSGGLDLQGIDISATAIAQLRKRLPDLANQLHVCQVGDLAEGLTFPLVIGIQVFQHGNRTQAHRHIRAAQSRTSQAGLFCLRVNAVGTDIWPDHHVTEQNEDGGLTVRYTAGPKAGLDVHFFSADELHQLFASDFESVSPLKAVAHQRESSELGHWVQWEGIWRRR